MKRRKAEKFQTSCVSPSASFISSATFSTLYWAHSDFQYLFNHTWIPLYFFHECRKLSFKTGKIWQLEKRDSTITREVSSRGTGANTHGTSGTNPWGFLPAFHPIAIRKAGIRCDLQTHGDLHHNERSSASSDSYVVHNTSSDFWYQLLILSILHQTLVKRTCSDYKLKPDWYASSRDQIRTTWGENEEEDIHRDAQIDSSAFSSICLTCPVASIPERPEVRALGS